LLQTYSGDIERTLKALEGVAEHQKPRLRSRAQCTWNWIKNFAPEDFRFDIEPEGAAKKPLEANQAAALRALVAVVDKELDALDEKSLNNRIYALAEEAGLDPKDLFRVTYQALVGKDQGPRLASFLKIIGRDRLLKVLGAYR
jgi:lysyl-tRNA synthetase class 1